MAQVEIFSPVLSLMLLTMIVWCYMYAKRIPFINSLDLSPDEVTPEALARLSPPSVSNPSDNLKNLFEVPILFYVLALYLYVTGQVDQIYLWAAWGFVAARALHSVIHCTVNIVLLRFGLYAISCLFVFFILVRAVIGHYF